MTGAATLLAQPTTTEWLQIIKAEYIEVPGLHLTKPQCRRLWGLDPRVCDSLLEALVSSRFLRHTSDDRYARADIGW